MALVHVVLGIVLHPTPRGSLALVARRSGEQHQGGLLEFPGGKIDPGESAREGLCRELSEEVGIGVDPSVPQFLMRVEHDYGDRQVRLDVFTITHYSGEPSGREGQDLSWRDLAGLSPGEFPAANRVILHALQQPDFMLITGEQPAPAGLSSTTLRSWLSRWPGNDCILRVPRRPPEDYRRDFERLVQAADGLDTRVLVHGDPGVLARCPEAAGIHLPWHVSVAYSTRPVSEDYRLGVSCHDAEALKHAERLGADYAFLSPVRSTRSHPDRAAIGWTAFRSMAGAVSIPVYALGGLEPQELEQARGHGACGIAGIRFWWDSKGESS